MYLKAKNKYEWRPWFAWCPVKAKESDSQYYWVWLETVQRIKIPRRSWETVSHHMYQFNPDNERGIEEE